MQNPSQNPYQVAYYTLLARLKTEERARVLEAKDPNKPMTPEVSAFVKAVIALAEQDDK